MSPLVDGFPCSACVCEDVLLQRIRGAELQVTVLTLWEPIETMLMWLVLRFLLRVNLDQNLVLSGAVLAHGLRRGEVQPADITRHPLFPDGGRDGAEGACPGCGKGSQLFTDPLPIPDNRWCISYVGLSGSKLLQLATGRSMEIIDWVMDAILFSESGVADVIDVSRLIRDGPQLSVKPLAERDRPRG